MGVGLAPLGDQMTFNSTMNSSSPMPSKADSPAGKKCAFCGADVTGKKFCPECGGNVV